MRVRRHAHSVMNTIKQLDPCRTNITEDRKVLPLPSRKETERMKGWEINTLEKKKIKTIKSILVPFSGLLGDGITLQQEVKHKRGRTHVHETNS